MPRSAWGDEITLSVIPHVIKLPVYMYDPTRPENGSRYFLGHLSENKKNQTPVLLCYTRGCIAIMEHLFETLFCDVS